jgi:hypothetical protein
MKRIVVSLALLTVLAAVVVAQDPETPAPAVCDGKKLPMKLRDGSLGVPVECCRGRDDVMAHEGPGAKGLAFRLLGKRCTKYGSTDPCSVPGADACPIGPCGAAPLLLIQGTEQHIFKPKHAVKACGYQVKLQPNSAGVDQIDAYPELYDNANPQVEYPKVTPSCPYTACLGHEPAITVSVTSVANGATGTVTSNPPGISLTGAGTGSGLFADPVKITANPTGPNARAVFSGSGCTASEEYGHTVHCSVPLAPDPAITVTFECKPGATCPH